MIVGLRQPCPSWKTKSIQDVVPHVESNGSPISYTSGPCQKILDETATIVPGLYIKVYPNSGTLNWPFLYSPNTNKSPSTLPVHKYNSVIGHSVADY